MAYGADLWQLYKSAIFGKDEVAGTSEGDRLKRERDAYLGGSSNPRPKEPQWNTERPRGVPHSGVSTKPQTAFLFCVMGGRFSEGVNFADALARLLVVVGMPFPPVKDTIFNLHKQHYEHCMLQQRAAAAGGGGSTASAHYPQQQQQQLLGQQYHIDYGLLECMISVNQTIGRAIRHSKDYAAILLVDRRYALPRVRQLLPRWILESLETVDPTPEQPSSVQLAVTPDQRNRGKQDAGGGIAQRLRIFFDSIEEEQK